jgi:hypothetical protein
MEPGRTDETSPEAASDPPKAAAATKAVDPKVAAWVVAGLIAVVGLLAFFLRSGQPTPSAPPEPPSAGSSGPPGSRTPGPWEYDPVANQHWNPEPGHNHWHSGPPPDGAKPGDPSPAETPKPWSYDKTSNMHWDPRPGHNHWHQGPPPPENQRR